MINREKFLQTAGSVLAGVSSSSAIVSWVGRGRRPGSHNALVSAALGRKSTRQLPRRAGSHNALADAAQPHTPIGTHSGILVSPLRSGPMPSPALRCFAAALQGGAGSSRNWDPSPTGSVASATARARQRGQRPTALREARRIAALSFYHGFVGCVPIAFCT